MEQAFGFNCAIAHTALEFALRFFPPIRGLGPVDPDVRASAVDYVNRVNWLFETWDLEGAIAAFAPDASVYHFQIPGVSRHASNHIVDVEDSGLVAVRYQNLLVRYADVEQAPSLDEGQVLDSEELPAIWLYSPMLDRLRKTETGWLIAERYIGGSTTNKRLTPADTSAAAIAPYLPKA
jgi:hypothetical protein